MMNRHDTSFLLLRPSDANEVALTIDELETEQKEEIPHDGIWARRRIVNQCDYVKELVSSATSDIDVPIHVLDAQLRRRATPHLNEHYLDQHHNVISQADIIASLNPTYNQMKQLCRLMQQNVAQQLIVLLNDTDERDTIIQDFRDMLHDSNTVLLSPMDTESQHVQHNRIFVAGLTQEQLIEQAIERMLTFKRSLAA